MTLEETFAAIIALRDSESVRALVEDCRGQPPEVAISLARVVLDGVRRYVEYTFRLLPIKECGVGVILGMKPTPMTAPYHWVGHRGRMKYYKDGEQDIRWKGKMRYERSGTKTPDDATHWCEPGGEGWYVIPGRENGFEIEGVRTWY